MTIRKRIHFYERSQKISLFAQTMIRKMDVTEFFLLIWKESEQARTREESEESEESEEYLR